MLRRAVAIILLAGTFLAPAPALAQEKTVLTPGITYGRQVEFTRHGPVVLHVLEAPKPGGLYSLRPVLSNGAIAGRETVSSMQRRLSTTATVAGVNGDLFTWADGRPSGILMQGGVVHASPHGGRSSLGIDATGLVRVDRIGWSALWQGTGQRRAITGLNQPPGPNGISLYTPAWGTHTPVADGATVAVIQPLSPLVPNVSHIGTVVALAPTATSAIPRDGAVLVARGNSAQKLVAEAPSGTTVTIRFQLRPEWTGIVDAIGGGPALVRGGKPIFRPYEEFSTDQMLPRHPRTAAGQRADGSIVLLAVDGRRPGYSTGMTNFEVAKAMVRLGAVTASALDAGGSTTMAFDGQVLNRPSDGAERAVSEGLFVFYEGVHAPPAEQPVVTLNGDGISDEQDVAYKIVRPSTVSASLIAPDRSVKFTEVVPGRAPGTYRYSFDSTTLGKPPLEGRWHWVVTATDDLGRQSSIDRGFWVNGTLSELSVAPTLLVLRQSGAPLTVEFSLVNRARVRVAIETPTGTLLRTLVRGTLNPGGFTYTWDGRDYTRMLVHSGAYVVRVTAENAFGPVELTQRFSVRRVATPKKPKPKPTRR